MQMIKHYNTATNLPKRLDFKGLFYGRDFLK
jgi:hypothetical protein